MILSAAILALTIPSQQVLIPTVVGFAEGVNSSTWSSEVRVTNLSDSPRRITFTDWIGTPGSLLPPPLVIAPGAIRNLGAQTIFRWDTQSLPYPSHQTVGAVVADVEEGLVIQTSVLLLVPEHFTGGVAADTQYKCAEWNGGYYGSTWLGPPCGSGGGPVIENRGTFFPPSQLFQLLWMHSYADRRQNIVLINPDPGVATVTLQMFAADGVATVTSTVSVAPHGLLQLNNIFAGPPFKAIRDANERRDPYWGIAAAARVVIRADTRLYAVGYSISNANNAVSVSVPY